MGIVNRSFDSSEQQFGIDYNVKSSVTGKSDAVVHLPMPATLVSARVSAVGLSGTPTCQLQIRRFVAGAGQTLIPLGAALTLQAVSTSGPQTYTFSTTALNSGDTVVATHAGTNAAAEQVNVGIVAQAVQSVITWNW